MSRVSVAALAVVFLAGLPLEAAAEDPQSIACVEDEVCAGETLMVTGTIETVDGGVFIVDDGKQSFEFRGIGPKWFWKEMDIKRPKKGQSVEVEGVTISCCTESLNVAIALTVEGQRVQLRDPVTGKTAWRGGVNLESVDDS